MAQDYNEFRRIIEDDIARVVDNFTDVQRHIAYAYIRKAYAITQDNIEYRIDKLIRDTWKRSNEKW